MENIIQHDLKKTVLGTAIQERSNVLINLVSKLLTLIAILTIVCSCTDEETTPTNPTNEKSTAEFSSLVVYGKLTDQDGNTYKTVTIGNQTWMAENLRTTKYNDGTPIPNVITNKDWINLSGGAYCNYNNTTNVDTIATYGRLYNWYAVNSDKLAPKGWHVPTEQEWTALEKFLGDQTLIGNQLKEAGVKHWRTPNHNASNDVGFTALPGGQRDYLDGSFIHMSDFGYWWSSTAYEMTSEDWKGAWSRRLWSAYSKLYFSATERRTGMSIRCVKD